MSVELRRLRREIDRVDEQLLELVAQRLRLAEEVAGLKSRLGLPVRDEAREQRIIAKVRERAKQLKIDVDFVENLMRYLMAKAVGRQRERIQSPKLWSKIHQVFKNYPAQLEVVRVLLHYGLRVGDGGEVMCGNIRIPSVQIAREAGVDRRTVEMTTRKILENRELQSIFHNLEPVINLRKVGAELGLGVIELVPDDAAKPGIVKRVTEVVARAGVSIRQVITDDPYLSTMPKLTIITDEPIKGSLIESLKKIPDVKSVIVY